MAGVITGKRCLLLVTGLMFCATSSAFAAGEGYAGLIAPAAPVEDAAPAARTDEPPPQFGGYAGLIPGTVSEAPQSLYVTPVPGAVAPPPPKTVEDVTLMAAAHDQGGMLNMLQGSLALSDQVRRRLDKPRTRIENVLPMEYAAIRNIDQTMSKINDSSLSPEERVKTVSAARQKLSSMAEGLRYKLQIPDSLYQRMGVSDVFVSEEKEGAGKALALLNTALKELDKY